MAEEQKMMDFDLFYNEQEGESPDISNTDSEGITEETDVAETVETEVETEETAEVVGDEAEALDDESESLVYDIDGEEISAEVVKEWKEGGLRQADYTKKTQALAEDRKRIEAKEVEVGAQAEKLQALIDSLDKLQDKQEIDWDYLRETDTAEYLKQKDLEEQRQKATNTAKEELNAQTKAEADKRVATEQAALLKLHPEWVDKDGSQLTEAGKADFKLINDYVESVGFTKEEFNDLTNHRVMESLLKAAKYDALGKTKDKQVKRAPKVVKPSVKKTAQQAQPKTGADVFYS